MTNQHPITPPLELVYKWADMLSTRSDHAVFSLATQWGADQELEACCGFIGCEHSVAWSSKLRNARRPKPPTLKEQALEALKDIECEYVIGATTSTIRRALEALPND
jgi:hypothetical protein